jgi:2',3'-cyclic-nucleotide 2'-phosphodiesterase (5'-nucleotidase family)
LRSSIKPGPVTVADIFTTMPYANELVIVEMSGADIERTLVRAVRGNRDDEDGGFLHVSGLTFEVSGKTVKHIRVGPDRRPLVHDAIYHVAVPDFLATGGDNHTAFVGKLQTRTGLPLRELIVDTIREQGIIDARVEGRIMRLD